MIIFFQAVTCLNDIESIMFAQVHHAELYSDNPRGI